MTMTTKRARYTLEFKQERVRLVEGGQRIAAAARTLGVVDQTLFNWVKAHRAGKLTGADSKLVSAEQMEISRLRAGRSPLRRQRARRVRRQRRWLRAGQHLSDQRTLQRQAEAVPGRPLHPGRIPVPRRRSRAVPRQRLDACASVRLGRGLRRGARALRLTAQSSSKACSGRKARFAHAPSLCGAPFSHQCQSSWSKT